MDAHVAANPDAHQKQAFRVLPVPPAFAIVRPAPTSHRRAAPTNASTAAEDRRADQLIKRPLRQDAGCCALKPCRPRRQVFSEKMVAGSFARLMAVPPLSVVLGFLVQYIHSSDRQESVMQAKSFSSPSGHSRCASGR